MSQPTMQAEQASQMMQALACHIDQTLNGTNFSENRNGFCLMVFPLDSHMGRCNYISNASKADLISLFKTQVAQFDGSYVRQEGRA